MCNTTVHDGSQGYSGLSPNHCMKCAACRAVKVAHERTIEFFYIHAYICTSLVYPDPYKKRLGNKARSSVHIGMC